MGASKRCTKSADPTPQLMGQVGNMQTGHCQDQVRQINVPAADIDLGMLLYAGALVTMGCLLAPKMCHTQG